MVEYESTVEPEQAPCDDCGILTDEADVVRIDGDWLCESCGEAQRTRGGDPARGPGEIAGEAYQVIGVIADAAGLFDHPAVQRALGYFADPAGEILPFSMESADA